MDWLSEYEKDFDKLRVRKGVVIPQVRMARVLRELAKLVKMLNALTPVPQIDLRKAVDLSDDAKELLG